MLSFFYYASSSTTYVLLEKKCMKIRASAMRQVEALDQGRPGVTSVTSVAVAWLINTLMAVPKPSGPVG